ncbi:hypothetical protein [Cyclobacterium sp. SYSU L10401]|uniref:hypothetical protein n=1 Tax=Cyclobacterium sp. SYSU L10401 TaxID=2678657 RepID=UPI0013CF770E|nr:hypothetical protein [Cyclobacterium sp. SYSU L10401]
MSTITLISTVHEEMGKCNADELCAILEKLRPEIVFLEALEKTYSNYDKVRFTAFGEYHQKLELKAIQKYSHSSSFEYVPVLDHGLSDSFEKKKDLVCRNNQHQKMVHNFNLLAKEQGFLFLNSAKSIDLQAEMRRFEYRLLLENKLNDVVDDDIDAYEHSMMRNIYSYCRKNQFDKAVFLCGVAHRRSIIKKIESYSSNKKIDLNWVIYGN